MGQFIFNVITGANSSVTGTPSSTASETVDSIDLLGVPRRTYSSGTTYDMYEHNISSTNLLNSSGVNNLFDGTYFFVNSAFRVYKVLYNLNSTQVTLLDLLQNLLLHHQLNNLLVVIIYNICTQ